LSGTSVTEEKRGATRLLSGPSLGWVMGLTATACFSTAPIIGRIALADGMDPTFLLLGRMLLATFLLGVTIALISPQAFKVSRRVLVACIGAGMLNGVGMVAFFWSLTRLEASMASMIISLIPLLALTFLALRGEKVTYRHGVRMVLALTGIYLLIGPGGSVDMLAVGVALFSVLLFALQMVTIQWYLAGTDVYSASFYLTLAITGWVVVVWLGQGATWEMPGSTGWISIVALAVFSTYIARVMMFTAISHIGSGQMSMLTPVETMLTIFWSFLFLGERLAPIQWLGSVLILLSAVLAIKRLSLAQRRPRWRLWARS
jgi:drug/metabolite transporter (DMT)-like permease